ncbi:hypothetical protein MsAg5_12790 [Methanosarcinaceae archaeon Ag5]|uniref:Uncharacterized protein n=1 Tax=Methanolapillus africanus TaxID=3028297 RepID=A0AAE4MK34_9EURY|nr:hypothetical protein [Methanosarcinaceae archaeon Ag5]
MNQKLNTLLSTLILFLLFLSLISPISGEEAFRNVEDIRISTEMPLNESEIQSYVDNTHPTDPGYFKKCCESEKAMASYGSVPLKTGDDAYDWQLSLQRVTASVHEDEAFGKYLAINGGPIGGYSSNIFGFVSVYLNPESDQITPQDIENMKAILDEYAQEEGIEDLPVVFFGGWLNIIQDPNNDKYSLDDAPISVRLSILFTHLKIYLFS